jgi:HAD superfamily hydrolase (TIGR01662 family)
MGRYSEYFKEIWKLQANRKALGITLFGAIYDNTIPFTPGNQLKVADGAEQAIGVLASKGYDLLIITGQPPSRTKNLDQNDFENILGATRELVTSAGGTIRNAYYAPGVDKTDPYVKPNTGMFERALHENSLDWSELFYVGAEINDLKAANKMKATPVLIKGASKTVKTKVLELTHGVKFQEFDTLLDFANSL